MVSAIITTHNRLDLLKRAINSVLTQTYRDIECIVVSDACTDGTADYCKYLEGIVFIEIPTEDSKGGNYARNVGIKASHGDYIAMLDDDDAWFPTKIEKQVALIQEKNCGLVYCKRRFEIVSPENKEIEYRDSLSNYEGDLSHFILTRIFITTSCILFSKELIQEVGLFDEELHYWQEYELTIRMAQRSKIYLVDEPLTLYRIDKTDNNRLTNKYNGWKLSVNYIRHKHDVLYELLRDSEYAHYLCFVWQDAAGRTRYNSNSSLYRYYSSLSYLCELNISDKELSGSDTIMRIIFKALTFPIIKQKQMAFGHPILSLSVFCLRVVRRINKYL